MLWKWWRRLTVLRRLSLVIVSPATVITLPSKVRECHSQNLMWWEINRRIEEAHPHQRSEVQESRSLRFVSATASRRDPCHAQGKVSKVSDLATSLDHQEIKFSGNKKIPWSQPIIWPNKLKFRSSHQISSNMLILLQKMFKVLASNRVLRDHHFLVGQKCKYKIRKIINLIFNTTIAAKYLKWGNFGHRWWWLWWAFCKLVLLLYQLNRLLSRKYLCLGRSKNSTPLGPIWRLKKNVTRKEYFFQKKRLLSQEHLRFGRSKNSTLLIQIWRFKKHILRKECS